MLKHRNDRSTFGILFTEPYYDYCNNEYETIGRGNNLRSSVECRNNPTEVNTGNFVTEQKLAFQERLSAHSVS
jgi:hypothetical protein